MVIQHNIPALNAHRNLGLNNKAVSGNLEKLSSGYRINRAADDAAGLAISEKMRGQIRGLAMAEQNTEHGINLIQTAEGALNETHSILQRMRELAVQSSNGTYQDEDRIQLTKEFNQLKEEIDRIAESTHYNNIKLLDGSLSAGATKGSNAVNPTLALLKDAFEDGSLAIEKGAYNAGTKIKYEIHLDKLGDPAVGTKGIVDELKAAGYDVTKYEKGATTIDTDAFKRDFADFLGIDKADYDWVITGTTLAGLTKVEFTAKIPGAVDPNHDKITSSGASYVWRSQEGIDPYNNIDFVVGANGNDLSLIGKSIEVNGITYKFVGDGDKTMDGTTAVVGSGDKLGENTYAIYIGATQNLTDTARADAIATQIRTAINNVEGANASSGAATWDPVTGLINTGHADFVVSTAVGPVVANSGTASIDPALLNKTPGNKAVSGGGLTFQIGANGGADQRVSLSINAMDTKNLGETSMDVAYTKVTGKTLASASIGTEEDANQAILIITGATDMVSTQRAELGALQNRLEHTLNSLGVSKENLTAAESTIRDVDMAKEMMEFTKNNILVQAAQAMLAQANQLPQGVLQLLR